MCAAGDDAVVDEELTAQNEEQDDAGDDVGGVLVQRVRRRDLRRTALEENQQERDERHIEGVELGQPCDNNGREAAPVGGRRGDGLILAGHDQEAAQAADRAGDQHRAHRNAADVDARIPRGVLALADNADLIALLGEAQIGVHDEGQHNDHNDVDGVALAHNDGEPAGLGRLVQRAEARRLAAHDVGHAGNNGRSNVVHHQGEQRLVRVPAGLEPRGDEAPQCARGNAAQRHGGKQQRQRQIVALIHHDEGGSQAADQDLALAAAVPEAHLEGRGQRDADAEQRGQVAQHPAEAGHVGEGAAPHDAIDGQRVQAGDEKDKQRIDDQRQQNGDGAHGDLLGHRRALTLGNAQQRLAGHSGSLTHACSSFTRLVIRRPTSSFVVLRPSRMPLTLPPHSTTMRSHSSSSTSRSSPT